jgi:predicted metal-dependent peptidase
VPWEREFHKYAGMTIGKDDYSLSPPHKRYLMDELIVPALRSYQLGKVVVAIDSSGSISLKALQAFASEVAKMATLVEDITIIVADAQIQQVVKTRDVPDFIKELKILGRGGTDHRPVFEEIQKQRMEPELFIGLTDGDTYYPEKKPNYPVMWCLTEERTDTPWGKRVFINV